jgi:hypothetical protein
MAALHARGTITAELKVFVVICQMPNRRGENTLEVVNKTPRAGRFLCKN